MSRKVRRVPVNHDRWLISYADFVTLLFAVFVVLFASSQIDKKKQAQLSSSIQSAFQQMGLFDAPSKRLMVEKVPGGDAPVTAPGAAASPTPAMEQIEQRLKQAAGAEIRSEMITIRESNEGLVVSLSEAGFFDSGVAEIRPSAFPVLDRIAACLPDTGLRIEGHTDDVPIATAQFASNWELSSARASSIARLLLRHPNLQPAEMSVAGYAGYRPIASNDTAEGRARNRRVDIVILPPSR
jgi:chemotaxis protein MotB